MKPLRSNLKPGSPRWAVRRAQWRALGLGDQDLEKPKIAIVNSSSELAICFSHLDGIAARMKQAIRAAGGVPFEVRTAAPSDFITSAGHEGGYVLPSRDLIASDIEVAVEGALLDGMVCLASCDKTVPGQLMAAARLDIPTIVVACGYQPSGEYRGRHVDIEDVFLHAAHPEADPAEVREMTEVAIRGPGVCPGLGTANSMHMASEALGLTLPGTTPVLANSARMWDAVWQAGERIVQLVWEGLRPREILTPGAFANAVTVMLAVGGSINTLKHLQAVAREAGSDVDVYGLFERLADKVPLLASVRPNGEHLIEELEAAGGTRAVMKQLADLLHKDAQTVSGRTAGELVAEAQVADAEVIRPPSRPFGQGASIVVLRGSLAPHGGIVKLGRPDRRPLRFRGPAVTFHSQEEAIEALREGRIQPGQVVVLRGFGPKGRPGMGMVSTFVFALHGAGLNGKTAVVTDGQLSGLVNTGLVVGEVSPEAWDGGPLGLVEDGDVITIDVEERRADLEVSERELARRRSELGSFPRREERGWLSVYTRLVRPLRDGAVLGE